MCDVRVNMIALRVLLLAAVAVATNSSTTTSSTALPASSNSTNATTISPTVTTLTPKRNYQVVRIYKIVNNFFHYIQPGYDNKLGLHVAHSTSASVPASNIIEYTLSDYEQKGSDTDDKFVVLRFAASLAYICMNHCAEFYTSLILNHDCVFALNDAENDYDNEDASILISKYMGINEKKMYIKFDKGYYSVTSKKNENEMVLFRRTVASNHTMHELTELVDEVNEKDCDGDLVTAASTLSSTTATPITEATVAPIKIDQSVLTLSSVIIGCVTLIIVVTGSVLIIFFILYFKNKNQNK